MITHMLSQLSAGAAQAITRGTSDFRGKHRLVRTLGALSGRAPIRSVYGPLMEAHLDDATNYFALAGYADDKVASAIAELQPGDAFIDVGANAGLFSLLAKRQVQRDGVVLAFEPQWPLAHCIRRNAALNGLDDIHVFPFALGTVTESAGLASSEGHSGKAHLQKSGDQDVLVINPMEIAPLLRSLVGRRRTMVKVDVEGAEQIVLEALAPLFNMLSVFSCVVEIDNSNFKRFGHSVHTVYALLTAGGFHPRFGLDETAHYDEIFERNLEVG